jgi:hypothetical protein
LDFLFLSRAFDFVFPFLPERFGLECGLSPALVAAVFDLRNDRGALANSSSDGSSANCSRRC